MIPLIKHLCLSFQFVIRFFYFRFCTVMAYQCEECGSSFTKLSQLLQHRHTQNHWKKYTCSRCNKNFNRKSNLDRHMLKHQNENNFHCSKCSKVFISADALENHIQKHENQTGGAAKQLGNSLKTVPLFWTKIRPVFPDDFSSVQREC